MPDSSVIRIATLLQACQNLERDLRYRGEVVGSLALGRLGGVNANIDLRDSALADRIRNIASGHVPDPPCWTPPWCGVTFGQTASGMGGGAGEFSDLVHALGLFFDALAPEIRGGFDPKP
jgi:hypothetical protein